MYEKMTNNYRYLYKYWKKSHNNLQGLCILFSFHILFRKNSPKHEINLMYE